VTPSRSENLLACFAGEDGPMPQPGAVSVI
jgi:hypothetical protein